MSEDADTVVVQAGDSDLIASFVVDSPVVSAGEGKTVIVTGGQVGPPGPRGLPGPAGGASFQRNTDGAMSALRIVWEDSAGIVHVLDKDDGAHINLIAGLTLTASAVAGPVTIQRSGPVDDDAWSWITSGPIWLGDSGIPTQTPPAAGYDVQIGHAVSPTRIYLDIQPPITLE